MSIDRDPILGSESCYHLKVGPGDVGPYVILPGDPGRVPRIAAYLDDASLTAQNREYCTYTGRLDGQTVSVTSTGIGGPSAAIALEELVACGAHTFIRVGTCGGMDLPVWGGDLILPTAAVRGDGTSREYLPADYPAVAHPAVLRALRNSAEALCEETDGRRFHEGVVQSKDSFYGETNPETMPIAAALLQRWAAYLACGCLASEMECATLFSVGLCRKVRVGAVLTAIWNVERAHAGLESPVCTDNDRAIRCAIEALRRLIREDREKA